MLNYIVLLIIFSVATEALTELVAKSKIFSPFVDFLIARKDANKLYSFFAEAYQCGYCTSVHVSLILTFPLFIFSPPALSGFILLDMFVFMVVVHRLSNYIHNLQDRVYYNKAVERDKI